MRTADIYEIVCLNGRFLPRAQASVSIFDRGFLYGDGVFETLRVYRGRPFCWERHWDRLAAGARYLAITLPFDSKTLWQQANALLKRNKVIDAVLRIQVTRGIGTRGYSPRTARKSFYVITLHPITPFASGGCRLITVSQRIAAKEPLNQYKTCNRLVQVLARSEAEQRGGDEALLLNAEGFVVEAASANLFCLDRTGLVTPPASSGALPGITRSVVMEAARALQIPCREKMLRLAELKRARGLFLASSVIEMLEVTQLDGAACPSNPIIGELKAALRERIDHECT